MSRRPKLPISARELAALFKAARAAGATTITVEFDGVKIIVDEQSEEQSKLNEWDTVLHHDED